MSRQGKAAELRQRVAVEAQDVNVAVDEIADIEKVPVGAESEAFGEAADIGLPTLRTVLPSIFSSAT